MLVREASCDRLFVFFFSSRRRHTRLRRDWSSDVCSSDLSLVILQFIVTEGEVVHGALTGGQTAQGAEQTIDDVLRGFHIAGDHGGGELRVQHAIIGNNHLDGFQAARIERNVVLHQRAEDVQHGGAADGGRGIEIGRQLRRGAGEVYFGRPRLVIDRYPDLDRGAIVQGSRSEEHTS